jgi:hypothetical protein
MLMRMVLAILIAIALTGGSASAAQPRTPAAQDQFVPMSEVPESERLPAAPLVFVAYGVVWVLTLAYMGLLWKRLEKVERDLQSLRKRP